jgi:hypothetical protein
MIITKNAYRATGLLAIALATYLIFTLLIGAANALNTVGERNGTLETLEPVAGLLMGFVIF